MQGQLLEFFQNQRKYFARLIKRALFLNGSSLAVVASAVVICAGLSAMPAQAESSDYDLDISLDSQSTTTKNIPTGLQPTTTKLLAPGSFGGNTQIPSGQYSFGFSTGSSSSSSGSSVYPGLPQTSLSSLDISIVDN